jgi:hypothetical protein
MEYDGGDQLGQRHTDSCFGAKGEAITGNYKGQLGEADVSGTIKGDDISLIYKVDAQGQSLTVTYTGKVAGNFMSGKVSLGQFGEGTFKGSKQ